LEIPVGSKFAPTPTKLLTQSALAALPIQLFPAVYKDKNVSKLNNYPKFKDEVAYFSIIFSSFKAKTDVIVIPSPKNADVSLAKIPVVIPLVADAISVAVYVKISLIFTAFNLATPSGSLAFLSTGNAN